MNIFKKLFGSKEKSLEQKEVELHEDKNCPDYKKELSSIKVCTNHFLNKGYIGGNEICIMEFPDCSGTSRMVQDTEEGMQAVVIHQNDFDKYFVKKYPEYKSFLRDEKLKQLGI